MAVPMARVLLLLMSAACTAAMTEEYVQTHGSLLWRVFKETYGKEYTGEEDAARVEIFKANLVRAAALQEGSATARFGAGPFADLTEEEFASYRNLRVGDAASQREAAHDLALSEAQRAAAANVTAVDWRDRGAVTHVKQQGGCGSCWAFSTTGGIEGQNFLHGNKKLTSLSEQELVSCDHGYGDMGCNGGLMQNAYKYLLGQRGGAIVTEAAYPYTSYLPVISLPCRKVDGMAVGAIIQGWKAVPQNETAMQAFVAVNGPLSVAVDARRWQFYLGGVVDDCTGGAAPVLDHGVLIVGFAEQWWIVKNSWGSLWGESGYIRVTKGSNQCGINLNAVTATFYAVE